MTEGIISDTWIIGKNMKVQKTGLSELFEEGGD